MYLPTGGVAFFDSGVGGLTVLQECILRGNGNLFYYYGDNQNAPYGNLSSARIYECTQRALDVFHVLHPAALVLACNTVTAVCAEQLRAQYPFPIIGAEPAIMPACARGGKVLVLATAATCRSEKFLRLCDRARVKYPSAELVIHPCPHLAGAIEQGGINADFDLSIHISTMPVSSVVLGCTHYIYIREQIKEYFSCPVYDGNFGISTRLSTVLAEQNGGDLSTKKQRFIHIDEKSRDEQPLFSTISLKDGKMAKIYFLGACARINKAFYEQMFANPYK